MPRTRLDELFDAGIVAPAKEPKSDSLPEPVEFDDNVIEFLAEQRR